MWQTTWRVMVRHRELALAATFAAAAGWELVEFLLLEGPRGARAPVALALHAVQILLIVCVAAVVLRAWQERTRYEEALGAMVKKVLAAQEEERRRIAFDVHDGLAQLIVSAKQHVDTCRELDDGDAARARHELGRAAQRLESAIVETRRVLRALRPSAMDSLGLADAMRRALEDTAQEAGWTVRFVDNLGQVRVPAAVETAAYRILQESLLNASRHASSSSVEVELTRRAGWLHLDVRDDGIGLDEAAAGGRGLGLRGMRERARLLGGTCCIERRRDGGTAIRVALPLGAEAAAAADG
jgi:signal transduction histidine kinase